MTSMPTYQPHWVREDFIDFIGEKIHPTWAFKKVKAAIMGIQAISPDFFKIHLRPNHNFKARSFQAGQHIAVTIRLDGVRHQRYYSVDYCGETARQSVTRLEPDANRGCH